MKIKEIRGKLIDRAGSSPSVRWGLLTVITGIFILVVYPSLFIKAVPYQAGDVAERDVKAPRNFFIEDEKATEANRRKAVEEVYTVYDHDTGLADRLRDRIFQAFQEPRELVNRSVAVKNAMEAEKYRPSPVVVQPGKEPLSDQLNKLKPLFEKQLGITLGKDAYQILVDETFSLTIRNLVEKILRNLLRNGVVANKEVMLRETGKGVVLRRVGTGEETVTKNLDQFFGLDQAKYTVRGKGGDELSALSYQPRSLVVELTQALIQPNITLNRNETEARRQKAELETPPVVAQIKAGEMLLREGERVTQLQLQKLNALQFQENESRIISTAAGVAGLIVSLILVSYYLLIHQRHLPAGQNKPLFFLGLMFIIVLMIARTAPTLSRAFVSAVPIPVQDNAIWFAAPIAACAMTACLFLGIEIAAAFAFVGAIAAAVVFHNRFDMLLYFFISGVMGSLWIVHCRERKVFIKAGAKLGLLNIVLATAVTAYSGEITWTVLMLNWIFAFIGGITAGIVTAGLAPLIEVAFGYSTDITLMELANLDQPLLRQLMIEAPGTYHHSMVVGSMVEAAASEIGANPLVAKVCGYYHDIGKVNKPLYFVENQRESRNRHDKLAPSMSSLILISHVKNGVEMAKKNKLGEHIIAAIQQHHGTSLIQFFYAKARKRAREKSREEDLVNIDDFRYPGPKPQTREVGLVMLADVVEAALRSLENPTPSRIQGRVQTLINQIFSAGELDNCELTLKDLHKIANSFNKILNGIHHHRIDYPDRSHSGMENKADENSDQKPAKKTSGQREKNTSNGQGHLRRLGIN